MSCYGIAFRPSGRRAARVLLKLAQEHQLDVSAALGVSSPGQIALRAQRTGCGHSDLLPSGRAPLFGPFHLRAATASSGWRWPTRPKAARRSLRGPQPQRCKSSTSDLGLAHLPEADSFQARLAFLEGDTGRALATLERIQPAIAVPPMGAYEMAILTRAMVHVLAGTAAQRRGGRGCPQRPTALGGGKPLHLVLDSYPGAAGYRTSSGGRTGECPRSFAAGCQAWRPGPGHLEHCRTGDARQAIAPAFGRPGCRASLCPRPAGGLSNRRARQWPDRASAKRQPGGTPLKSGDRSPRVDRATAVE